MSGKSRELYASILEEDIKKSREAPINPSGLTSGGKKVKLFGAGYWYPHTTVMKYCEDVLNDNIPSGIHLKNAVKRFIKDFNTVRETRGGPMGFQWSRVKKVMEFIRRIEHFKGEWAGKKFEVEPWQAFIIANLYGFYWRAIKNKNIPARRRFNTAYIEVARKNGKSSFVAALALYALMEEGEAAPEILLAANSKDQARICWNFVDYFSRGLDKDDEILRRSRNELLLQDSPGFVKTLAADPTHLDGYDCHLGIVDEYHSAPNTLVRDVLRSSMGMRKDPLLLTITTAGFDKNLPCYSLRTLATEIAAGVKDDDSFFGLVFSLDEDDDWKDPSVWIKANPNLGVTVRETFIRDQIRQALNSPSDEVGIRTKNLNQWCDSSKVWVPEEYLIQCIKSLDQKEFKDKQVYVGVDLASTVDLTAVAYLHYDEDRDKYKFRLDYYLPKDTLQRTNLHADKISYKAWARAGYIKLTAGNVTDYSYITRDLLESEKEMDIQSIYYDRYNALQWAIQCTDSGLKLTPYSQTIGNFNIPTRELERLILSGKVEVDKNPVTMYCFRNVELRMDMNGNVKPNRDSELKKIDGVIAMLQALAAYMDERAYGKGTDVY